MSFSDKSIDTLTDQTQTGLSLSSTPVNQDSSSATSSAGASPQNGSAESTSTSPSPGSSPSLNSSRQFHSIGSASGGPPPRANNIGTGGPSSRSGVSPGPNNVNNVATGGPGSRTRANEMTRQLASTRLPPSLQARLAAVSFSPVPTMVGIYS